MEDLSPNQDKLRFKISIIIPAVFVLIMWLVFFLEKGTGIPFTHLGLKPQDAKGLIGIFTMPFLHGSLDHLASNSLPILILGATILYIYREFFFNAVFWIFLLTGIGTWIVGRTNSYHIGASGIVYGLAFFLFVGSVFGKNRRSGALAFMTLFLYGGLIWGLLPLDNGVSYEGHIMGALSGILMAVYYRNDFKLPPLPRDEDNLPPASEDYDYMPYKYE